MQCPDSKEVKLKCVQLLVTRLSRVPISVITKQKGTLFSEGKDLGRFQKGAAQGDLRNLF